MLHSIFAEASASTPAAGGLGSFIVMIVMLVGLFLIMIIPQRKREKQIKSMLDSIKVGDRVRTIGGIYGTVVLVKEDVITIVSGPDDVKLVFAKGAVATVEDPIAENDAENEHAEESGNTEE